MKGRIVTWFIGDTFRTTADKLVELGLEKIIPRNAYQTALKKSVDLVKDRLWNAVTGLPRSEKVRRAKFMDVEGKLGYVLVVPYLDGQEYATKNALSVKVDKKTGALDFTQGEIGHDQFTELSDEIIAKYRVEKNTVDADQFRAVVGRLVEKCNGISLRSTGGIYYIDERYSEQYAKVKSVFDVFPGVTNLIAMPVYDDAETLNSIEFSTTRTFDGELNSFIAKAQKEISTGSLTTKRLKGLMNEFDDVKRRASEHAENMRTSYEMIKQKNDDLLSAMKHALVKAKDDAIPVFDLAEAMAGVAPVETDDSETEAEIDDAVARARALSQELGV